MPWARLDDGFDQHPKIRALLRERKGAEALALHVLCITMSARNLTDGLVDKHTIRDAAPFGTLRVTPLVTLLVTLDLWDEVEPGEVWQIHDYLDFNPSKQEVLIRRANDLNRQRRHRRKLVRVTA